MSAQNSILRAITQATRDLELTLYKADCRSDELDYDIQEAIKRMRKHVENITREIDTVQP